MLQTSAFSALGRYWAGEWRSGFRRSHCWSGTLSISLLPWITTSIPTSAGCSSTCWTSRAGDYAERRQQRRSDGPLIDGWTDFTDRLLRRSIPIRWRPCSIRSVPVVEVPAFLTADTAFSVATCSPSQKLRPWCLPMLLIRSIRPGPARQRPSSTAVSGGASGLGAIDVALEAAGALVVTFAIDFAL